MTSGGPDLYKSLESQGCRRPLTDAERKLGQALEAIFASGRHAFDIVAVELNGRGVLPPSGATEVWTPSLLLSELEKINASLDAAYAEAPAIGSYA